MLSHSHVVNISKFFIDMAKWLIFLNNINNKSKLTLEKLTINVYLLLEELFVLRNIPVLYFFIERLKP